MYCCCCLAAKSCLILFDPMDCSLPGSSVHGISQQEYRNGLPFLSPGDLPDLGIKPTSLGSPTLAGVFFTTEPREISQKTACAHQQERSRRAWGGAWLSAGPSGRFGPGPQKGNLVRANVQLAFTMPFMRIIFFRPPTPLPTHP